MKNTCLSSDYIPWFFPNSLPQTWLYKAFLWCCSGIIIIIIIIIIIRLLRNSEYKRQWYKIRSEGLFRRSFYTDIIECHNMQHYIVSNIKHDNWCDMVVKKWTFVTWTNKLECAYIITVKICNENLMWRGSSWYEIWLIPQTD